MLCILKWAPFMREIKAASLSFYLGNFIYEQKFYFVVYTLNLFSQSLRVETYFWKKGAAGLSFYLCSFIYASYFLYSK